MPPQGSDAGLISGMSRAEKIERIMAGFKRP